MNTKNQDLQMEAKNIFTSYEEYGCRVNYISVDELFERYKQTGFLYQKKLAQLNPYWDLVRENWKKAERGGELLHSIVDTELPDGTWASLTSWRHTENGWNSQHLVGASPMASQAVVRAILSAAFYDDLHKSHQCWFQRKNRFANKLFGTFNKSLRHNEVWLGDYGLYGFEKPPALNCLDNSKQIHVREFRESDRVAIKTFISKARSNVFL